jgi:anaerobic magnesium-protoporphyrin IX monomethyl ester cyclase
MAQLDVLFVDVPKNSLFPEPSWCLGYRYMTSNLRANGFTAELLYPLYTCDGSARPQLIADILNIHASIVGFTTYDIGIGYLLEFIKELRRAGLRSHVTLGGLCASAIPDDILKRNRSVDSIIIGEGEFSIVDLARYVIQNEQILPIPGVLLRDNGIPIRGAARCLIEDLDEMPEPVHDHLESNHANNPTRFVNGCAPVVASRGCYGRCSFCCIHGFYRGSPGKVWRGRNPERIADEIRNLVRLTGLQKITFVDENFMGPGKIGRQHAVELSAAIKKLGLSIRFNFGCRPNDIDQDTIETLKEAGLAAVSLGIESMAAPTLDLFNKGTTPQINYSALGSLEKQEIFTEITFIFFHPLSTIAEIRENLRFIEYVRRSRYAYFNNHQPFTGFIPFFGTELTNYLKGLGLVRRDLKGYTVRYADPRVGFIARRLLAFPTEYLTRLQNMLPGDGSQRLAEIKDNLGAYQLYLSMERLPSLVSDLCDLFEQGTQVKSRKVRAVTAAIDQEEEKVKSILQQFVSHIA